MSSPRHKRKRANAAASTPFATLGGFALMFGILAASTHFVEALRLGSPEEFNTPGFLSAAAIGTMFISAAFYYREKRRLP